MASVGDVLLPILGGLAGTDPYIGSGLRSALSVSEALARSKQRKEQDRLKGEQEEAEAAEMERQEAERKAYGERARQIIENSSLPAGKKTTLLGIAERDPEGALDTLYDYEPPEPEPMRYEPGQIGSIREEILAGVGPGGSAQATIPMTYGGTVNATFRNSAPEPEPEPFEPDYRQYKDDPWNSYWIDENGQPQITTNEAMREMLEQAPEPEDEMTREAIEEAELELAEARAELQEYIKERTEELEANGLSPDEISREIKKDERRKLLETKVDILESRYMRSQINPPPMPQEEEAAAEPETLHFDRYGNPLG